MTEEVSTFFGPLLSCNTQYHTTLLTILALQNNLEKGKFLASFFKTPVAQTKCHRNGREVMEVLMLKPGEYLIVPCTVNPNETGSFILMIHSKEETSIL